MKKASKSTRKKAAKKSTAKKSASKKGKSTSGKKSASKKSVPIKKSLTTISFAASSNTLLSYQVRCDKCSPKIIGRYPTQEAADSACDAHRISNPTHNPIVI